MCLGRSNLLGEYCSSKHSKKQDFLLSIVVRRCIYGYFSTVLLFSNEVLYLLCYCVLSSQNTETLLINSQLTVAW